MCVCAGVWVCGWRRKNIPFDAHQYTNTNVLLTTLPISWEVFHQLTPQVNPLPLVFFTPPTSSAPALEDELVFGLPDLLEGSSTNTDVRTDKSLTFQKEGKTGGTASANTAPPPPSLFARSRVASQLASQPDILSRY